VVYTPDAIARECIDFVSPVGLVLDPCMGDGAYFRNFPKHCTQLWCEIDRSKDFMNWHERVDWVIGNPPYSTKIFLNFLTHSFGISPNVVFLLPVNKVFQSQSVMSAIANYGGIQSMLVFGSGQRCGFPFGFSVASFHFRRGYDGDTKIKLPLA